MISIFKKDPLIKIIADSLINLPRPRNINYWWNLGSLLGMSLMIQILTGLFLSFHYRGDTRLAFFRVRHISRDVNLGWLIRTLHANGARLFFLCLYFHIGRGLYYNSYNLLHVWRVGVRILLIVIAAAFLGYVLPWGQISFWGATVITNLFSAIPFIGRDIVTWLWGGFAVDNSTLTRFYSLHFLVPFVVAALVIIHLFFLHLSGSSNPLGLNSNTDKVLFNPYFRNKDLFGVIITLLIYTYIRLFHPWALGDPENFINANPIVTPIHIQPEWYFLFAYAILRSIPNKLGGVIALAVSVIILWLPGFQKKPIYSNNSFCLMRKIIFWLLVNTVLLLTWIGARPVEAPYVIIGQSLTILYFAYFLVLPFINHKPKFLTGR